MVYDGILLVGVIFFGFFIPNVLLGILADIMLPNGILLLHFLLVVGLYFVGFWRRNGQTLAMKTWKVRLVAADGGRPDIDQLILRFLLAWPSVLVLGIGLFWAPFDRDRQFLHDRLSGTRLVFTG